MTDLENIFRNNRELFNDKEPSPQHMNNFLDKLNKEHKKKRLFDTSFFLKVAAIAIFVLFSGVFGYQLHSFQVHKYGLGTISPEYQEVELFYTSNIDSKLNLIRKMDSSSDLEKQEMLKKELKDMDQLYIDLKKELKANPGDERVIQAMIEYYQVKSNILNKIIEHLYQVKRQKVNHYESTQI